MMTSRTILFTGILSLGCLSCAGNPDEVKDARSHLADLRSLPTTEWALFHRPNLWVGASFYPGELGVDVSLKEKDPVTGQWEESMQHHPVSYSMVGATARHGMDLFLIGRQRGYLVIERWTWSEWAGGYHCTQPESEPIEGVPVPLSESSVFVAGSTFLPVADRSARPQPTKTEVYRSDELTSEGRIVGGSVDPEGRFLLIVTQEGNLYEVWLDDSDSAQLLLAKEEWPDAPATSVRSIQHENLERQFVVEGQPFPGQAAFVLVNPENDGAFLPPVLVDVADIETLYPPEHFDSIRFQYE